MSKWLQSERYCYACMNAPLPRSEPTATCKAVLASRRRASRKSNDSHGEARRERWKSNRAVPFRAATNCATAVLDCCSAHRHLVQRLKNAWKRTAEGMKPASMSFVANSVDPLEVLRAWGCAKGLARVCFGLPVRGQCFSCGQISETFGSRSKLGSVLQRCR